MQICGDELVYQEECDLGSGVDFDGCTDECMVEVGFACRVDSNTAKSICSYTGELEVELLTIEKEMFSNTLKLAFSVDPQLQFFNTLDPNLYLNFDDPDFLSPSFSFSETMAFCLFPLPTIKTSMGGSSTSCSLLTKVSIRDLKPWTASNGNSQLPVSHHC